MMFGFTRHILRVNLEDESVKLDRLSLETARKFLGGRGLGTKILFDELRAEVDPLGPENKLLFLTGPIAGTPIPGNSRYCVMAKSPATGLLGEAYASGFLAAEMKFAGYDAMIFEGIAHKPTYLWVDDTQIKFRDASHIWGKNTAETEKIVKSEVKKPGTVVASIGVAGERLVNFAAVISDLNRAAGRTGMGAVMGSKNLKAIAVHGSRRSVKTADPQGVLDLTKDITLRLRSHEGTVNMSKHGTAYSVPILNTQGILPTRNFQKGFFEKAEDISGEKMSQTILKRTHTCYACPVACKRMVEVKSGLYAGDFLDGPEYETLSSLGSLLENGSLEAVSKANHLCNLHSLDTISTGNVIAFAMECYEKGILTGKELGDLDLAWGNASAIIEIIDRIAKREGVGDILAHGVMKASQLIGRGSEDFAVHVKGLEVPMHEPRGKKGVGLMYAVANRGGAHTDGAHDTSFERENVVPEAGLVRRYDRFSYQGKAEMIMKCQNIISVINSMCICFFTSNPTYRPVTVTDLTKMIKLVTGFDFTADELMRTGERIFNLGRAFDMREGLRRRDDRLPKRFMEPLQDGSSAGEVIMAEDFDNMLDEYYRLRGWDQTTGVPSGQKLAELGLEDAARSLLLLPA